MEAIGYLSALNAFIRESSPHHFVKTKFCQICSFFLNADFMLYVLATSTPFGLVINQPVATTNTYKIDFLSYMCWRLARRSVW
jgi:hypothetical protein